MTKRVTDHFVSVLLVARRLHLHEHVLDAVNIGTVFPSPPGRPRQRGGFVGGASASVCGVVEVVGGLLERRQARLVGVAVGRGTPQVRAPAAGVAPRGRRGFGLHHVW